MGGWPSRCSRLDKDNPRFDVPPCFAITSPQTFPASKRSGVVVSGTSIARIILDVIPKCEAIDNAELND